MQGDCLPENVSQPASQPASLRVSTLIFLRMANWITSALRAIVRPFAATMMAKPKYFFSLSRYA
mgnify:CR=1 FL=1